MQEREEYRSTIGSRSGYTPRARSGSGGRTLKIVTESRTSYGTSPRSPASFGGTAATAILESREKEKKEMMDLNDRLASYIEKVRFLEAQNRKLSNDLESLRNRWGRDTHSIRQMYEGELAQAKRLLDDTGRNKADIEKDIGKLRDQVAEFRRKYDEVVRSRGEDKDKIEKLLLQLSDAEAELGLLRRRVEILEEEVARLKKENVRLAGELQRARTDLDQETLNRIDFQNQVQTLLEEIDFIRRVHDQEIKELQGMAARDTTAENREFFRNELATAIRDIRAEYDSISGQNRNDMESWYKLKVQEIQTASARQNMEQGYQKEETRRLRTQLGDLRGKLADLEARNSLLEKQVQELSYQIEDDQRSYEAALNDRDTQIRKMREECQALMVELQMLLDTKQTLDAEIAIYRKMLEGEENRGGLRQLVEQVVKTHSLQQTGEEEQMRVIKGETATRSSYQRAAKGNISIMEVDPEGKFIVLENTNHQKEEKMDEWRIKRSIDGRRQIVFTLPPKFLLPPGKSVKIWARGAGGVNAPPDQMIFEGEDSWGTGANVQTFLFTKSGEEKASHIQRSSQDVSGGRMVIPPVRYMGTVHPARDFDPRKDAEALNKALKGFVSKDTKTIMGILCRRSNAQRQQISGAYKEMFEKDLVEQLNGALGGDFKELILALMQPPAEYDANTLRAAMKGAGTDEQALIDVLCTRSNQELRGVNTAYNRLFQRDLQADLKSETSGPFQKLLIQVSKGVRDESNYADPARARRDAEALHKAGVKKWGTDEAVFVQIISTQSNPQLLQVFKEYRELAGHDIEKAIQKEMSGDLQASLMAIVQCTRDRCMHFAVRLYQSMKGIGTNDALLIYMIVSRCEIDMVQVKQCFQTMYTKTLESWIKDDTSGKYKEAMMLLVEEG